MISPALRRKQSTGKISGEEKMNRKIKMFLIAATLFAAVVMNVYGNVSVAKAEGVVQEVTVDRGESQDSSSAALTLGISAVGLVAAGVLACIDVNKKDDI